MRDLERFIVLQTVDTRWREHLENMDYMREGIGLRGLAQKDPLVEYRNEGHLMFQELTRAIREEVVTLLFHAEVTPDDGSSALQQQPQGCRQRQPQLRARVARGRRCDPRRRRLVDLPDGWRGRRRLRGDACRAAAEGELRVREHRPQRPVLVRLGQEVQEVPRRLTARWPSSNRQIRRSPTTSIRLDPISQADHAELLALVGDDAVVAFTHVPTGADAEFVAGWIARYVRGWEDGSCAGFVARDAGDGAFLGVRRDRPPRPGRPAGRDRLRRRSRGARPRRRPPLRSSS